MRDIHHTLSKKFILEEWKALKIPSEEYAEAIALVSEGHRIVDIGNPDIYKPKFTVKSGRSFVCLPYLAAVLRISDELDITNIRTPSLLTKYYMPDNEKSILEWDKHIANTKMFITENYVEFDVKCSNYSMLAALEEQFNKIATVINYCQKVIRNISNTEKRNFSLKLEQIRNNIKYIDFDPKGIKYSFDVDNVINAFVGENLYNDKLTSIRELLQNSIDTCKYKKVLNPDYNPDIKLYIEKNKIKIEDNGLGMDEFIIKNYFGKLCSSFYQQESVKKEYDAIGQFGVGVFSYFLMADYIDIETKTEKSETLHFRLDKDPKNYFHFFKKSNRKTAGTTITLYLKKEYDNYNITDYLNYIKDKFRYIEFPIVIQNEDESIKIIKQDYNEKNLQDLIYDSLKHQYKSIHEKINFFTYNFNNKKYEGAISLIYLKDFSFDSVSRFMNNKLFKKNRTFNNNLINICQKGVLINDNDDDITDFSDIYCNLNFKEKVELQISRNHFSDNTEVSKIMNEILNDLTCAFFEKIISENPREKLPEITFNFLESKNLKLKKTIYSKLYLNFINIKNKRTFITYEDFLNKKIDNFILSYNKEHTEFLKSKIKDINIIEFYLDKNFVFFHNILNSIRIFNQADYNHILTNNKEFYYLELIKGSKKQKRLDFIGRYDFINTRNINTINLDINSFLWPNQSEYFGYESQLNFDHPFVVEIFSFEETKFNQKSKELTNEIFQIINSLDDEDDLTEKFSIIKELEKELKKHLKINYELTLNDIHLENKQK